MINIREKYIELTNNSYCFTDLDDIFITFISCNNILTLIYSSENKSIIAYNLNEFQIITEIKNPHKGYFITNFRHFFDKYKKIDLIMSISAKNCQINIWNNKNWELIFSYDYIYTIGRINSACFIQYDINNLFIVTSNNFYLLPEPIKIYNFENKLVTEISNSKVNVYYIDTYINNVNLKIFIIACCYDFVISYDYNENIIYKKYNSPLSKVHYSFKIIQDNNIIKLIESSSDGNIRIWDFNTAELLSKITLSKNGLYGICLLNKNDIAISCADNCVILFNYENKKIKKICNFDNWICCTNFVVHKKYGKCIITQGIEYQQIKLMSINDILDK